MNLKGGVLIIGSLFWEDHLDNEKKDNIRLDWRAQNLSKDLVLTEAPIRYARQSSTRKDTYTMIFSKSCENNLGQGLILPFNEKVTSFESIEKQAIALAIAEGIYKPDNKRLTSSWGSVGLLINPELNKVDFASYELIQMKWSNIYKDYSETFMSSRYKTNEETESSIAQTGLLNINWQKGMDDFDLLIGTPVIPKPKTFPTAKNISDKINETGYKKYFEENRKNKILTFQDSEIVDGLNKQ
ncbi:MAG TPA: hypothetical protein VGF79_03010 [Bacteroidia bacterium]